MNLATWLAVLPLLAAAPGGAATSPAAAPGPVERDVSLLVSDGVLLAGVAVLPEEPRPGGPRWPVALLLHPFERDRDSVLHLADALARHGIAAVAMDQRGRGGSRTKPGQGQIYAMQSRKIEEEMRRVVADQGEILARLRRIPGVDPARVALVGVLEGGLVALETAAHHPEVKAVVLVDVTEGAAGFRPERDIAVVGVRPVLLVHSAVPRLAAQAERLSGYGHGERRVVAIDSFDAGAQLLTPGGPATEAVAEWLAAKLGVPTR